MGWVNKVAVCSDFQDYSQLTRDYGDKESKVIQNTVGNIFNGQVVGDTAKIFPNVLIKCCRKDKACQSTGMIHRHQFPNNWAA